ncbi:hypothetical protein BKA66DRAFT_556696 [Pyrenochaeta sp. MPI-SDFR-AT-0127]|nr:hypothetical protein BKA66DRAFT_556696 [Pyrenochaeta sp. MPI-SDFR-AT-0127]
MGNIFSLRAAEDNWQSYTQYAMDSDWFCVVCGGPFNLEGEVYNLDSKERSYQWLFDFRLLGNLSDMLNHRVTGEDAHPANLSDSDDVFLSDKAWFSMTYTGYFCVGDAYGGEIWFDALRKERNSGTLIALHDACISISCRVIEHLQTTRKDNEKTSSLLILNKTLQDRFRNGAHRSPRKDRDLLDLGTTSKTFGPRSVLALNRLEWWGGYFEKFYTNPIHIPNLTCFAMEILHASPNMKDVEKETPHSKREPQGIERLPNELIDHICTYLPAPACIALHRVSKRLFNKVPLDTSFWRNSLLSGNLLPHIWDLDKNELQLPALESTKDWRTVARLLETKRFAISECDARLDDIPNGLWNRCRIWSIMEEAFDDHVSRS